jgi:hypothetical protein
MRSACLIVTTLLLAYTCSAAPSRGERWQNALKPAGQPGPELCLAERGQSDYVIVTPAAATAQEKWAAEALARWLHEITRATFPIVADAQAPVPHELCVGKTNRLTAARPAVRIADLGDEGYLIAARGERLFLLGGAKRGPINAVLALLEEDLGCRWFTATEYRIPRHATLKFRPVLRSHVPPLEIRDPFYANAFNGEWSLMNRTNAPSAGVPEELGGHIDYAAFVHTFNTLVPPDQYFATHPEYFMQNPDGKRTPRQLCLTNPEVVRVATESCLRILKDKPNCEIISVSKNDGGGSCVCPNCKAIDQAEGTDCGSLLTFVNKVAENVEKTYPRVQISTLAYLETYRPPKTIRPRANVAIQLCTDRCMWAYPFTPARENKDFSSAMVAWGKVTKRIHVWDYCVNFSHYVAPMPNMDVVADNIRFFIANNCRGVMEQGAYQSAGSEFEWMRCWVMAKLMWDPSLNLQALMRDFIFGYYGKAAPAIAEYNDLLYSNAARYRDSLAKPSDGIRYPMDSPFLSREFLDQATALFERAEKLAITDPVLHRVRVAELPVLYVKLCRGPQFVGPEYLALVDKFEAIAKREGLTYLAEGPPDLAPRIRQWREAATVQASLRQIKPDDVTIWQLPNEWRFAPDPKDEGVKAQWFAAALDDGNWAKVRSDKGNGWESQGFADYTGFGWYRQRTTVPANLARKHLYLYFGAVDEDAFVYINDKLVCEHSCASTGLAPEQIWQTPFSLSPLPALQMGQANTIAVRVYNRLAMGGVYKPAYLVASDVPLEAPVIQALVEKK